MSSYTKHLKNPKTGKIQKAVCQDDYYGSHRYGYGFKNDGSDFDFGDNFEDMTFHREEELKS